MVTQKLRQILLVLFLAGLTLAGLFMVLPALAAAPPFLLKWGAAGSGNGQFLNPFGVAIDRSGTRIF